MKLCEHVRLMPHETGAFVLNLDSDRCFGVNETGAAVLRYLKEGHSSTEEIARSVARDAATGGASVDIDQVRSDVSQFIKGLQAAGLIE